MPNRKLLLLGAATTCAALALPSAASAADFCVGAPAGCSGTPVPPWTLASTLTQAETNGSDDRFFLAPGVYFSSSFNHDSAERVQIVGAGAGKTIVRGNASAPVLELGGNADSSVAELTIEPLDAATRGLTLKGARARGVVVDAEGATAVGAGVSMHGSAAFDHGSVDVGTGASYAIAAEDGTAVVTDSTLVASEGNAFGTAAAEATLRRSTVHGKLAAVAERGHLTISDTLIDVRDMATGPATAGGIVASVYGGNSVTIDADRVTIVGSTPATTDSVGVFAYASEKSSVDVRLRDSVISGIGVPLVRSAAGDSTADLSTRRSAYPPHATADPFQAGPGTLEELDRLKVGPGFVDAAGGNFHLAADSPLIDAGTPDPLPAGAADRDGKPRASDGDGDCRRAGDIGAFEYQGTKVRALARAAAATATTGQSVGFSAAGSCIPGAGAPSIRWRFDDGGGATGASTAHAFATPGRHTATVTVSDAQGHAGQATATVDVSAPTRPTPPPPAPQITRLRVAPSKIEIGSKLPKLVRTAARRPLATIGFRLSKRATVTLRFATPARLGGLRTIKPALRVRARAGRNAIRFAGRLTRRVALRPGSYRLTAIATDDAGTRSAPVRTRFTVVGPRG